jgi:hypothetical protein
MIDFMEFLIHGSGVVGCPRTLVQPKWGTFIMSASVSSLIYKVNAKHSDFGVFFFNSTGFELRASPLLGSTLPLEQHHQPFFALVIFQSESHVFA